MPAPRWALAQEAHDAHASERPGRWRAYEAQPINGMEAARTHDPGAPVTVLLAALVLATAAPAAAQEYTAEDVQAFADDYAWWYEHPGYPHDRLLNDVMHIMRCETGGYDQRVINNRKLGRLGEVGAGQFHPRGIWASTPQAEAGYSVRDVEANVAALTWGVSQGFGPTAWRGCW